MPAEKLKILQVLSSKPWNTNPDMIGYKVEVQWGSSTGKIEQGEINARSSTKPYAPGDTFEATREVDAQGRIKFKRVAQQGAGGGFRAGGGGGYRGRPPAGIPYGEAITLYKQITVDLGDCYVKHPESATSIMIAIYSGDVLRPGQRAPVAPPASPPPQAQAGQSKAQPRPSPAPPPLELPEKHSPEPPWPDEEWS
jgi:hypothetical protein